MTKIQSASGGSNVLNIEYWNLDIVCYLLFGAWNFFYSKTQFCLDIHLGFCNRFMGTDA
jgi:hypothetical protein